MNIEIIEKNPADPICEKLIHIVCNILSRQLALDNIFAGYNKITDQFFIDAKNSAFGNAASIGNTSSLGFDLDYIKGLYNEHRELYLYYLAIPIDENDILIGTDMLDWEFTEMLQPIVKRRVGDIGAISYKQHKRCRTFKWFDE